MAKTSVLITGLLKNDKPVVIDDLKNGQGTVLYNHNIKEVLVIESDGESNNVTITDDEEKATGKMWQYDSLRVEYPKTRKNIYATLLEAKYPADIQQKLLNDFQSADMGILEDEEAEAAVDAYKAFLTGRKEIKEIVKQDCLSQDIPDDL